VFTSSGGAETLVFFPFKVNTIGVALPASVGARRPLQVGPRRVAATPHRSDLVT